MRGSRLWTLGGIRLPDGVLAHPRGRMTLEGDGCRAAKERMVLLSAPAVYLLALTVCELAVALWDPRVGLVGHLGLLATTLALGSLSDGPARALWLACAIGPLVRVVSLGSPMWAFPPMMWFVLSALPLFVSGMLVMRASGMRAVDVGLRCPGPRAWPLELVVAASGLGLGAAEWYIVRPSPMALGTGAWQLALSAIIILVCTGLLEEFLFRGVLRSAADRALGSVASSLFGALVFAALHIGYRSLLDLLFVGLVALYFDQVVRRTGSIVGVTVAHGLTNIVLFVLIPLWRVG